MIDVLVSEKRALAATRRFFARALQHGPSSAEVTIDRAAAYVGVLDELAYGLSCYRAIRKQPVEANHGRLKSRLQAIRGLKQLRCARVIGSGRMFIKNVRRGHTNSGPRKQ
jgi:transposase, IS6 family